MNALRTVFFTQLALVASFCCSAAAQVAESPWNVSFIGHLGGWCWGIHVEDRYAFVTEGGDLTILDLSTISSPVPSERFSPGGFPVGDIEVDKGLAYMTAGTVAGDYGLLIVDIATPVSPRVLSFYPAPIGPTDVYVTDGVAYVTFGSDFFGRKGGFEILDVSNSSSPTLLGSFVGVPFFAWKIYVIHGIGYVAARDGLHIFDVTGPSLPARLALYRQSWCNDVVVTDGLAYTATEHGLEIIDVTSPTTPTMLGYHFGVQANGLFVSDGLVFLAEQGIPPTYRNGLAIIDVANPSSPTLIGSHLTPGWAWDVVVSSGTAYLADWMGGLSIIDVTTPSSPTLCATYDTLSDPRRICVAGGVAYVANGVRGLKTVDVSDPRWPMVLASVATSSTASRVDASGGFVYVSGTLTDPDDGSRGVLQIFDVTNPSSPTSVGSYDRSGGFGAVTVSDGTAYVVHSDAMLIIDVANPSSPMLRGSFVTPGLASDVFVSGDLVFIADYTSLQIVDVQNPTSPVLRSSFPGWDINNVFVSNGVAYITGTWAGADFKCIDVTNADAPRLLGSYDVSPYAYEAGGLSVSNGFAYVLLDDLRVLDVSDPTKPTLCGFYPAGRGTFPSDLFACGNLVYLVDTLGLRIFQFTGDNTGAPCWRLYR